ncbi:Phosphate transport system permease protein PstC 1 [Mycobacterium attenuatum]|nr:Phosphate transport system permease protein PstC 1 [Mycobacterium attenuatum]
MAATTLSGQPAPGGDTRAPALRRSLGRDGSMIRWAGGAAAVIPLLALGFVLVTLVIEALPAIRFNGLHFFTGTD